MHVNPALGGGLSGTLGNARVVPDVAELQLARSAYGPKPQRVLRLIIAEADGSPSVEPTQIIFPNGSLSVVGTVATFTPQGTFTFAATAPVSPIAGDRWVDSTSGIMYTYINDGNSTQWVEFY